MVNFKIKLGFVESGKHLDGTIHNPFALDLSKFPSLFIDYNHVVPEDTDVDEIASLIMTRCAWFRPEDKVKCVVIDGFGVAYNTVMEPGTYKREARNTMLKRLNSYVSKIYDEYLHNPNFTPKTKYVFLVCRIGGLEQELIKMLPKLGAIGVYLIMADDASNFERFPYLFFNLYGKLTYHKFESLENKPEIKYEIDYPHDEELVLPTPEYVYQLERLRPSYDKTPVIYSNNFIHNFYITLEAHKTWEAAFHKEPDLTLERNAKNDIIKSES